MLTSFFWPMIGGAMLTTFSATAALVLNEIAWHELEEYTHQKNQKETFGRILDLRDQLLLGASILQMLATAILTVSLTFYLLDARSVAELSLGEGATVLGLAAFGLILTGTWLPWAVTRIAAVPFLFRTWRFWLAVSSLAWPLLVGGRFVSATVARAMGRQDESDDDEEAFEDEILSMVSEGERDGFLEPDTRDMIEGIMELDDKDVAGVMTHRSQVDAMEESTEWNEMMERVVDSGRTRIPIYRKSIDHIIGVLYAKDLLREFMRDENKRRPLNRLLREPLSVPESTLLDEMLSTFLHVRIHMAIVRDEYGGMAGVVTIEDVLEEIVGEIVDETDKDQSVDITILNPKQADVKGSVHIDHLNEVLGIELPEQDEFDSVSGLIMHQLNEIPRPGREIVIGNVQFNIQEADRRQIKSVRVTVFKDEPRE